ncbi:MAG: class I SAM-dependent methyltransferase [Polyangiales bacterium]
MTSSNTEQLDYWNNAGGARWVAHQETLDRMVRPFGEAALARLAPRPGEHALDVGCGCGDTLLALAGAVGSTGSVTGIDPSRPMLARARARIGEADLIDGDASTHSFTRRFDLIFSRFGVMFFADPIAAFRHLSEALAPGGRLGFVCWRDPAENPWVSVPVAAVRRALPHLPPLYSADPNTPGAFSLARPGRVDEVLRAAGFSEVAAEPFDAEFALSSDGPLDAARVALVTGPASRLLADASPDDRERAIAALAEDLVPHSIGGRVALRGAAWSVLARV